jgi:uncharacterized repeat protein (TIGR04076 family)
MRILDSVRRMIVCKIIQKNLGYSDEEMARFKERPQNLDIVDQAPAVMKKIIVAEVVDSRGCNSGHKKGDKLYFDGAGNLLTSKAPSRVCIYAMEAFSKLIYAAVEMAYAGADPNAMRFNRTGCTDVGLECGGWGRIVLEISVQDRKD